MCVSELGEKKRDSFGLVKHGVCVAELNSRYLM